MSLRTKPTQARSAARIDGILGGAASIVDEVGVERLSTNLVATRADCSIGTLYRYFPDRHAVLRALALRHIADVHAEVSASAHARQGEIGGLESLLLCYPQYLVRRFRTQPGFRAIAYDHAFELPPRDDERYLLGHALGSDRSPAAQIAADVARAFARPGAEAVALASDLELFAILVLALVDRAFAASPEGSATLIEDAERYAAREARRILSGFEPAFAR